MAGLNGLIDSAPFYVECNTGNFLGGSGLATDQGWACHTLYGFL